MSSNSQRRGKAKSRTGETAVRTKIRWENCFDPLFFPMHHCFHPHFSFSTLFLAKLGPSISNLGYFMNELKFLFLSPFFPFKIWQLKSHDHPFIFIFFAFFILKFYRKNKAAQTIFGWCPEKKVFLPLPIRNTHPLDSLLHNLSPWTLISDF